VNSARLAELYQLPAAYLNKQLQALVRAGILSSVSGPRGGFQLAQPAEKITVLDVVLAIEGQEPAFRCESILAKAPGADPAEDYLRSCLVSQTMRQAELAWRQTLSRQTVAGIAANVERKFPGSRKDTLRRLMPARF
jgi:Rrf2 family protein